MNWPAITVITGKGGVGKSSVSAGLALSQTRLGKRTLLVELGEESYFQYFFGLSNLGFQPVSLGQKFHGLDVSRWEGGDCLRDYVAATLRLPKLTEMFFESSVMQAFIDAAPALSDVSILGKLTSGLRGVGPDFPYDSVVVDGYAAGHMLAMVRAPGGLAEAVRVGPMGTQSREIADILKRPEVCQLCIVSLAEELPITETLELRESLQKELGYSPRLLLNRTLPNIDWTKVSASFKDKQTKYVHSINTVDQRQREARQRLGQVLSPEGELLEIPRFFTSDRGEFLSQLSQVFAGASS